MKTYIVVYMYKSESGELNFANEVFDFGDTPSLADLVNVKCNIKARTTNGRIYDDIVLLNLIECRN